MDFESGKEFCFGIEGNIYVFNLRYGTKKSLNTSNNITTDITGASNNFGLGLKVATNFNLDMALSMLSNMIENRTWSTSVTGKF